MDTYSKAQEKIAETISSRFFRRSSSFLRVLAGLDRSRFLLFLMELGPEARLFHLGDDLLRRHLRFVVNDGHALRHQIDVAAFHPRQTPGHFFHGRAACGAVHPGNVIYFFPHGGSSFEIGKLLS